MRQPDLDGNLIPREVTEGSAQFAGRNGTTQEIRIGVSTGIFNVQTATCGGPCLICQTTTDASVDPNPTTTPFSGSQQATFTLFISDGSTVDQTSSAHWSSSNTSIATVQTAGSSSPGMVSGIAIGTATLTASADGPPEGPAPSPDCQSKCGLSLISRQAPAPVTTTVTIGATAAPAPPAGIARSGGTATITPCVTVGPAPSTYTPQSFTITTSAPQNPSNIELTQGATSKDWITGNIASGNSECASGGDIYQIQTTSSNPNSGTLTYQIFGQPKTNVTFKAATASVKVN
jgi:hypothetical protein